MLNLLILTNLNLKFRLFFNNSAGAFVCKRFLTPRSAKALRKGESFGMTVSVDVLGERRFAYNTIKATVFRSGRNAALPPKNIY